MATLEPGRLRVASYAAFAPVCWREGGKAYGRDIDFLRAFAKEQGLELDVAFFEFDRIWERPGRGEVDIAAAGIAPLPERQAPGVVWSEPYFTVRRSLIVRAADGERLATLDAFGGRTVGATRGSTADIDTVERKPPSTLLVYYDMQDEAVEELLAGVIDGFGTGDVCSQYLVERHPGELAIADVHEMEAPEHFAFVVRAASDLLPLLNAFIQAHKDKY
ncbi:MAG: ABC transporter substrate-binding protein [Caldilineaceae bacterium]